MPLGEEELQLLRAATAAHERKGVISLIPAKGGEYASTSILCFNFKEDPARSRRFVGALLLLHDQRFVHHEHAMVYRVVAKGYRRVRLRPPAEATPNFEAVNLHLHECASIADTLARECWNPRRMDQTRQQVGRLVESCLKGDRLQSTVKSMVAVDQVGPLVSSLGLVRRFFDGEPGAGHGPDQLQRAIESFRAIARALRSRRR